MIKDLINSVKPRLSQNYQISNIIRSANLVEISRFYKSTFHIKDSNTGTMILRLVKAPPDSLDGEMCADEIEIIDSPGLVLPPGFVVRDMISIYQGNIMVQICIDDPIMIYVIGYHVPETILFQIEGLRLRDAVEISAIQHHPVADMIIDTAEQSGELLVLKLQS